MKKTLYAAAALCLGAVSLLPSCAAKTDAGQPVDLVNPRIGSGGHGHVFVGANVPFGMVQVGPVNISQGWDWCSGYHESDSTIMGFAHTHLSGTGCSDLLDITVMPVVGKDLTYAHGNLDSVSSGLHSFADRSREVVEPGYYSVPLTRYGIDAEMTATSRVGLHRYTFPESDEAAVIVNLADGVGDYPREWEVKAVGDNRLVGYRHSQGWAPKQKVFFTMDFSEPFESFETVDSLGLYGRANFKTKKGQQILAKVAISAVSPEGATANLEAELPGWDFDNVRKEARDKWNAELSKIQVKGGTDEEKEIFYTALYHSMIAPSEFSDVNGNWRGADDAVHENGTHQAYTTFSLWDTYRSEMPLLSIIQPERYADMINTMVDICDEQGRLPVWHLWANETNCMVGNPAIPVVADAIVKDIPGVDKERAYKALLTTAMNEGRGNGSRMKLGYIPYDEMHESIAFDMEYALADWALAQAAQKMGDQENYEYFLNRSKSYKNYFEPEKKFMVGKDSKGNFRPDFNEFDTSHRVNDYCEGNAWQYLWLVPHDVDGLVELFGSKEATIEKLDSLFIVESTLEGADVSPDVAGLIGQYAHGNEPSHHTIYLYNMLGQPEKAQKLLRQVLKTMYSTNPDGLSGNEDVGQMSAWYLMTAMGLYEVEPGSGRYWFGSPLFEETAIRVPGGTFTISAPGASDTNIYVKEVKLNGKTLENPWIEYSDIMKGGTLEFTMTDSPS